MAVIKTPYANSFAFLNSDEDEAQLIERVSALLNGNGTQKRPDDEQNMAFGERNNGFQRQRPPYNNRSHRNPSGGYQQWVKKDKEKEKEMKENGCDGSWQSVRSRKARRGQQGPIGKHGYYRGRGRGRGHGKGANFGKGKGNHNQQQGEGDADVGSEFTSGGSFDGHRGKPPALSTNPQALEALKNTGQERVVNPDDGYNMKVVKSQEEIVNVKSSTKPNKDKKTVPRPTIDDFFPAPKGRRNNKKHMEHKTTQELEQVSVVLDLNGSDFPVLRAPQRS